MTARPILGQRQIVGRTVAFTDGEVETKYTLPFVDGTWHVPFVVLDRIGGPPGVLDAKIHSTGSRLRVEASIRALRPIETIPIGTLERLVHFDPWWAFRGVSGVPRPWIESIVRTNIAHPFRHEGRSYKIQDLLFPDGMERLEALVAKDELFHPREFRPGELDLSDLRPKAHARGPRTAAEKHL